MTNFASSALFNLIAGQLKSQGLEAAKPIGFEGKTEAVSKRDLLNVAMRSLGPSSIFKIGQALKTVDFDPTLEVLLNACDGHDLIDRWTRLERYFHGRHRVRVINQSSLGVTLEHFSTDESLPTTGEDLVISGLIASLLQLVGCRQLTVRIGQALTPVMQNDAFVSSDDGWENLQKTGDTRIWQFEWIEERNQSSAIPSASQNDGTSENNSIVDRVTQMLGSDPGRNWKIDTAATIIGQSKRSLQRMLQKENETFQKLLRRSRAEAAASMILSGRSDYAEIGYASGFADQPHFNREFKLRYNMQPSEYRTLAGN